MLHSIGEAIYRTPKKILPFNLTNITLLNAFHPFINFDQVSSHHYVYSIRPSGCLGAGGCSRHIFSLSSSYSSILLLIPLYCTFSISSSSTSALSPCTSFLSNSYSSFSLSPWTSSLSYSSSIPTPLSPLVFLIHHPPLPLPSPSLPLSSPSLHIYFLD